MSDIELTPEESAVLRAVLSKLSVRERTGEVGIIHGADRFVSTQLILKKSEREKLTAAALKLGARVQSDRS